MLANAKSIIEDRIGFTVSEVEEKEYSDVMKLIYGKIEGPMFSANDDSTIPMSCETGQITIEPGNNSTDLSLMLTRSVARIDVGVGTATKDGDGVYSWDGENDGETVPFQLKHVYVVNPNDRYAVVPNITLEVGMPTIPEDTEVFTDNSKNYFEFAATEDTEDTGGFSRDIYVPEVDIKKGGAGTSGDDNHISRMAIVVGGCYNGSATETFYRLDFADSEGNLMNVLRNHLYLFSISKVLGDGYSDVESAYKAQSENMTADIHEWNETGMGNIAFDGQNYLSVSQSVFNFTCDAIEDKGENNVLSVKTDVTEGWTIGKIVDTDEDVEMDDATSWVTVKMMSDGTAISIGGDTPIPPDGEGDKTEVYLTVKKNETEAPRSAVIWIAAGRMRYSVTVNQLSTSAPVVYLTDENGNPVTELVFADDTPISSPILKVSWGAEGCRPYHKEFFARDVCFRGCGHLGKHR